MDLFEDFNYTAAADAEAGAARRGAAHVLFTAMVGGKLVTDTIGDASWSRAVEQMLAQPVRAWDQRPDRGSAPDHVPQQRRRPDARLAPHYRNRIAARKSRLHHTVQRLALVLRPAHPSPFAVRTVTHDCLHIRSQLILRFRMPTHFPTVDWTWALVTSSVPTTSAAPTGTGRSTCCGPARTRRPRPHVGAAHDFPLAGPNRCPTLTQHGCLRAPRRPEDPRSASRAEPRGSEVRLRGRIHGGCKPPYGSLVRSTH